MTNRREAGQTTRRSLGQAPGGAGRRDAGPFPRVGAGRAPGRRTAVRKPRRVLSRAYVRRVRRQAFRSWAIIMVRRRIASLARHLDRLDRLPDAAAIHGVRVSARRLRATLRHLAACFRGDRVQRIRAAIRRAATTLGRVRDLDILIENLAAEARRPRSTFAQLVKRMQARREDCLQRAVPDARLMRQQLAAWQQHLEKGLK